MRVTLLWQRICIIDTNDARYTFSFFLFFFSCFHFVFVLRITHLAFIDEINKEHIACLQMVKMNGSRSSVLPPLPSPTPTPQINPLMGEFFHSP